MPKPTRTVFAMKLLEYYRLGVPYRWGARGRQHWTPTGPQDNELVNGAPAFMLDCSGAGLTALFELGGDDKRWTFNTDALARACPPPLAPKVGDPVFYGAKGAGDPEDMDHVEWILSIPSPGTYIVVGASGGGSKTLTLEDARKLKAGVKVKPSHLYRSGFRRFGSMDRFLAP